jgi:hypothetical protein
VGNSVKLDSDIQYPEIIQDELRLYICEESYLPPFSETIVNTKLNKKLYCGMAFVKGYDLLKERKNIYPAKGLVECSLPEILLLVANLSSSSCRLPKGAIVGSLEKSTLEEWNEYLNVLDTSQPDPSDQSEIPDGLNLNNNHNLNKEQLRKIETLIKKYSRIFNQNSDPLTRTNIVKHKIETGEAVPINQPPYRASPNEREKIKSQIDEMLAKNVI